MEKVVAIIDLKSFYASCECSVRHLDPFSTPLVCCDPYRGPSSVVMSVTPYLKEKYKIPNVCRKKDLPNIKGMIYAEPRMSYYLLMSAKVVSIFLDFVAEEDLHVYSIDESFLNLTPYLSMYGVSPETIVSRIQRRIYQELGLIATAGIGPNMFLAKVALDEEGKKKPPYIAHWNYSDVSSKLWQIPSLSSIWGIGEGISNHLKRIGINSIKELALAPKELLKKEFGIIGYQLKDMANGLDESNIQERYLPKEKSLTLGETLQRGYSKDECYLLLREMTDSLSERLREEGLKVGKVSLSISSNSSYLSKQRSLPFKSHSPSYLYESLKEILEQWPYIDEVRHISIAFSSLESDMYLQMNLLGEEKKEEELNDVIDKIHKAFGKNAIYRCSALLKHSTIRDRRNKIGGHRR